MNKVFIDGGFNKGIFFNKTRAHFYDKYYAFEPDQRMFKYLALASQQDWAKDTKFIPLNVAIWIENCSQDFNQCNRRDQQGGSLLSNSFNSGVSHKTVCVDFVQWVDENINRHDYNVLKLDIEGAEYEVLLNLIKNGKIYYFDRVLVEFHRKKNFENSGLWDEQGKTIMEFFENNKRIKFELLK